MAPIACTRLLASLSSVEIEYRYDNENTATPEIDISPRRVIVIKESRSANDRKFIKKNNLVRHCTTPISTTYNHENWEECDKERAKN